MKGLIELLKLIYGSKIMSRTLGTRTNVIRLPDKNARRYIKEELNIEAASDELAKKAYKEMEQLIPEVPRMNDAERLIFEGNLRRLANKLKIRQEWKPTAEVFEFGTKEKVTPKGIETLKEQAGQKSPPGTVMGNIESRLNKLRASGEDLSTMKGQTLDEIMGDVASSQQRMRQLEKQGLVRATARDIITSDIKSGKLKLPKELEKQILEGGGEPIDILRNVYGEDALEVLDSLIPEFSKLRTSTEAEKLARSKFKFEPNMNRSKGSMTPEEAAKAEQENILTPSKKYKFTGKESMKDLYELEEKGIITRDDMNVYSPRYIEWLDAQIINKEKLYTPKEWEKTPEVLKNKMRGRIDPDWEVANFGEDFDWDKARALEIEETQKLTPKKPDEPEEFATGGRVGFANGSKGLDYLMGIERRGYAEGTDPTTEALKLLLLQNSGGDSFAFSTPTKEESEYAQEQGMQDVGENKFGGIGGILGTLAGLAFSGLGGKFGKALSMGMSAVDPNSITRQALSGITNSINLGFNPFGRQDSTTDGFVSTNDFSENVDGFSAADFGGGTEPGEDGVDTAAQDADQSGGDASSTSGTDAAGDGGDGYATGGLVNRTGFKFGTKFGRFWKIARKVWDDINPTGDRKYDAQLVADELADRIFNKFMDELPQNVQIDLYALAYNNAPKVDALFRNPQNLSEAAKKGMAASKEMESLGLDVTKSSDFFKYEEMKLSGQLGPEHQVQAYKDKIRDEFYGVIDDTLMKQVEVDDNPQRLAEVYASIKEGLTMQEKGMTPEEIIRVMKQTPRTKNSQGGLNYLMGY